MSLSFSATDFASCLGENFEPSSLFQWFFFSSPHIRSLVFRPYPQSMPWLSWVYVRLEAFSLPLCFSLTFAKYWPLLLLPSCQPWRWTIWQSMFLSYIASHRRKPLGIWGHVVYLVIDHWKQHWGNETCHRKGRKLKKICVIRGSVLCASVAHLFWGPLEARIEHVSVIPLLLQRQVVSGIYPLVPICHC